MLVSARLNQLLRQRPIQEAIFSAASRRTLAKSSPLRPISRTYINASRPRSRPSTPWHITYRQHILQRFRNLRFNSTKPNGSHNPTPHLGSPEPQGIKAKLSKLVKDYGWVALGVYLTLSALDLPLCFLAVRLAGPERVGRVEHSVLEGLKTVFAPVWRVIEPVAEPIAEPVLRRFRKEKPVQEAESALDEAGEEAKGRRKPASELHCGRILMCDRC